MKESSILEKQDGMESVFSFMDSLTTWRTAKICRGIGTSRFPVGGPQDSLFLYFYFNH